jgi:hypothetical protein
VLRAHSDAITVVVDVFLHDPLYQWVMTEDKKRSHQQQDAAKVQAHPSPWLCLGALPARAVRLHPVLAVCCDRPIATPPPCPVVVRVEGAGVARVARWPPATTTPSGFCSASSKSLGWVPARRERFRCHLVLYQVNTSCHIGLPRMAEYACCSFERPDGNASTFLLAHLHVHLHFHLVT